MVKTMKPGSVIVDMAAEQGGNCELTEPGKAAVQIIERILQEADNLKAVANEFIAQDSGTLTIATTTTHVVAPSVYKKIDSTLRGQPAAAPGAASDSGM